MRLLVMRTHCHMPAALIAITDECFKMRASICLQATLNGL